jgi:hypothetical protein
MRCPRCDREIDDDEDAATCDVCGAALASARPTPAPPAPVRAEYTELVRIYVARDEGELALVRAILAAAGIPAYGYVESLHSRIDEPRAVAVPVDLAARAAEVLRRQGVVASEPDMPDLERLWLGLVAPLLSAPHAAAFAAEVGRREPALRAALFADLERAGPRGLSLLSDLVLALALRGPDAAAREAAVFLAACEAFRGLRPGFAAALGALVRTTSPVEVARRVAGMLARFRGLGEAERGLVPLLAHAVAGVRDEAIEALYSISGGETLGFEPDAPEDERARAVERWWARVGGRA